ncbi:MAG: hypothetical protein JSV79_09135 [Armatimonadota bacterium]|nr:MAG: hypothetical protein JSV79_09135 [Armatimonadota bacterium]
MIPAGRSRLRLWGTEGDAIIVNTDRPWRLVLWEKAQYVPCWDLGGDVWFTPEWMETHSPEDPHCYEPIMDKACRFSQAQILESGPARSTVHWQYALCDSLYRIFRGNSRAEEYYHVYPDGVAVRHLIGWPGNQTPDGLNPTLWEIQEFIIINGVGVRPENCIEPIGFTLANLAGDQIDLKWPNPFDQWTSLCSVYPQIADWSEYIGLVHLRHHPDPFVAFPRNPALFPFADCASCGKPHPQICGFAGAANYSHWPANDSTDFVGWTEVTPEEVDNRATHTSFFSTGYSYRGIIPPRPSSWLFLTGAVTEGLEEARRLAGSWLAPARVDSSHLFEGYAYSQRAYRFRAEDGRPVSVRLNPTRPILNPVLRLYHGRPPVEITWNGAALAPSEFRSQAVGEDLLLWINRTLEEETSLDIVPA